jgi:small subunit ribosomal protein S20
MTAETDAYNEYLALAPIDRTLRRLLGATEVIAAARLFTVLPGAEPWVVEGKNEQVDRAQKTSHSKKRARQNKQRFAVNKARHYKIRTYLRKVEEAIASGDKMAAEQALSDAQNSVLRGVRMRKRMSKNTSETKTDFLSRNLRRQ